MPAIAAPPGQRIVLKNISGETYERLLAENLEAAGKRFAYDNGTLEIRALSARHENPNRTLALIVETVASETERDFYLSGSTTFKRKDLGKAVEPDSSFYFVNADRVRGKDEIDLASDPPPELVIEVDVSNSSLNRFPIFAGMGVEEVWRYDGGQVRFHRLEGTVYHPMERSIVLPPITAVQATLFLDRSRFEKVTHWVRSIQEWVRANL